MSSRGKRSSILKKQQTLPPTSNGRASPVASLSSAFKSGRKIEFNRKKSVKEFLVGEDVDTIWGNSYEVSTDGTPSGGLDDATLANSTSPSITIDEQNKENRSHNQPATVGDDSLRRNSINAINTSWDLSITIADDERRRIRSETSAVFSQSLNTTERLLVEPFAVPQAPGNVRIKLNGLPVPDDTEVQAMDISPIKSNVLPSPSKSPRKMIYTFPKQAMFVEINDVPSVNATENSASLRPSWRTATSGAGSSYNEVSETWNSHPHAAYHQRMLAQAPDSTADTANISSEVDTTIALTNAMTKVLQSCSNESIQKAVANMDLDESTTTTIPTNALARARPSFLPSNPRVDCVNESQLDVGADRTPISTREQEKDIPSADISSPLEGHAVRDSLSFDNLSLLNDIKQREEDTHKLDSLDQQQSQQIGMEKSSVEGKRETLTIDFGLSSLSMNGRPSSPEIPVVIEPRILRPPLPPRMLLELANDKKEMKKMDVKNESDTPRMTLSRQKALVIEDLDENRAGYKKSLVPMDISPRGEQHITSKPSRTSIHSRMTANMVESPEQPRQTNRSTVFLSNEIVLDHHVGFLGKPRDTVVCDEKMELTAYVTPTRHTDYGHQELILDEMTGRFMKRSTVLGTISIDESSAECCSPHSPQTALNNYRKTVYPLDRIIEDTKTHPDRQTIVCNESMALDKCATPTSTKSGKESSSISCVVYGRNVDELSIHATRGNNVVDMTFARPTSLASNCRRTLMQEENMAIAEGTASNSSLATRSERLTTHAPHAMEETETTVEICPKKSTGTNTRKSNVNAEAMELTLVEKSKCIPEEFREVRHTMYATEVMDESKVEPALCVRMDTIGHAECVDLYKPPVMQKSRIPRLKSHLREDMQDIPDKPRYSIYERADMDVTKVGDRSELQSDERDSTVHLRSQIKSRLSVYNQEPMNATNICEDQPNYTFLGRESIAGDNEDVPPVTDTHDKTVIMDEQDMKVKPRHTTHLQEAMYIEAPNDITNYNTFLEQYESSHATATTHQMDLLQEKAFNSTRLSRACEREDDRSRSVIHTRLSSYRVEAMDETTGDQITPPDQICPMNMPEKKPFSRAELDSPMHMSPVIDIARKSVGGHNSRKTVYYPEELNSEPESQMRKSDLQRIAKQSDPIDMEGISVLESDAIDPKSERDAAAAAAAMRGTIFFNNRSAGSVEPSTKKQLSNRLSIYDAAAMIEETVPIDYAKLKQRQASRITSAERKSNDCMEETIVPDNIRVERDAKYVRQSVGKMASPIVCPAEHPPAIDPYLQHDPGTPVYGTEETMEVATALIKTSKQIIRSRQTIHQPASMDLTLVDRGTVTPPPVSAHRVTIYDATKAMDETPPYKGPEIAKNAAQRRTARQTILISQDMDVEDVEEDKKVEQEEQQQSFTLSMLPRETTEDCIPRSASILPKRTFSNIPPSLDSCSEVRKPSLPDYGPEMNRQLSQTSERQTVTRNDSRAFHVQDLSDISMSTSTMQPELAIPCIGNITAGMMSIRELPEALPSASFQEQSNSVSVICRVQDVQEEPIGHHTMAFISTRPNNGASDDEFYDAEEGEAATDPLSLTKSRHLTMKFIDVGQLEQTGYSTVAPVPGPFTASKRVHAQVLNSPFFNRPTEEDQVVDPLQMTNLRQSLQMDVEHTPHGPIKKRPRTSFEMQPQKEITVDDPSPTPEAAPADVEELIIKEERQTLANFPAHETLIHDPSVFVMEEQNLLDDESDIACTSLTEEHENEHFSNKQSLTPPPSSSRPPAVCKLTELSYYKNFANLTIDTFDSGNEEASLTPDDMSDSVVHHQEQEEALVAECISVSDEDSLIVTPPKVPLASHGRGILDGILNFATRPAGEEDVLESTIASEIMYQIRQKHPIVRYPCCGMQTECLCRMRRELKRQQEVSNVVWNRWCSKLETIKQRIPKVPDESKRNEEKLCRTIEEQIEELNWRLLRGKLDESFLFVQDELSREDVSRRRSRTTASGHYPETPSLVFLAENLRSFLSEESYVDCSPPPGAPMPRIPRITQLIANKLSTDPNTHWQLDCSEERDGVLLLRHRTLRSFVLSIQLAPPRTKNVQSGSITENWRLERIQVRECQQEYVHSPKLLLAHIEFMRVAKETTERTLRSTYRTVGALMGLWHRFDELLQRVFDAVNRLLTIIRNNEALLYYDAQMERFCVKKCFHRTLDDGQIEANILLVNFSWIGSIGASGVSFKWPIADPSKLLPSAATSQQQAIAPGSNFMLQGVGTNDKAGLMFLECLLWNVAKQYES
ncbi:uncharacterized protein LOC126567726 [Anopheles maculipalpis]|uniref:uncharacterized protein LOC126567726 n=1 Tax=Anopheles maculipalpis TaxID=1496333 RepID=UPI002159759C|nr:uncharacterized protein LOC126567726 [Anopheles maculipalpis]